MSGKIKISIAALFVVLGVGFFFTPYLAVNSLRSAAEARDAEKLASHVDFPALKESLKATFNARLAAEVAKGKQGNAFSALGAAMAAAFINPMIDALVTPESLAMMMKGAKPQSGKDGVPSKESDPGADISMSYESFNRFVVAVKARGEAEEPVVFVFNRDGIIFWKLSAIRLPL
ncbi:DUF2939 domain-containing protein [Niveibacterium terrae]|uniref:DUF2939 domain-containing protein n=1 Tax=Niveibacterium terrae TaxID=3373598 RepID=UPI003A918DCE